MASAGLMLESTGQDADSIDSLTAFYGDLFGLGGDRRSADPDGVGSAVVAYEGGGLTTLYVRVEDIRETLRRALAGGGRQLVPVTQLPEVAIAVIADPLGHPVGLSQDLTPTARRV